MQARYRRRRSRVPSVPQSGFLFKELSQRAEGKKGEHYVVFFYDEYGFQNHPISKFVSKAKKLGVTFVFMKETIERTWSMTEYQHTIGLVGRGITDLLYLKYGLEDYTKDEQEKILNRVIDRYVRVLWGIGEKKEPYKQFKENYLKPKIEAWGLEG